MSKVFEDTYLQSLIEERDAWKESAEDQVQKLIEIANHRDALAAAAKLAWVAIVELRHSNSTDKSRSVSEFAVEALRKAGVK